MNKIIPIIILVSTFTIIIVAGCTSFVSINRHNNGSCQHLDYTTTNELKSDSSQYTINND